MHLKYKMLFKVVIKHCMWLLLQLRLCLDFILKLTKMQLVSRDLHWSRNIK